MFNVSGIGYESIGEIFLSEDRKEGAIVPQDFPELILAGKLRHFAQTFTLPNILMKKRKKSFKFSGDPTEASNLVFLKIRL